MYLHLKQHGETNLSKDVCMPGLVDIPFFVVVSGGCFFALLCFSSEC